MGPVRHVPSALSLCLLCVCLLASAPDPLLLPPLPSLRSHYEDKHAATGGVTTQGVAVRGTVKAKRLKEKGLTRKPRKVDDNWEVPSGTGAGAGAGAGRGRGK